ncbi:hypothetical protein CEXT_591121 [Caerostris extrusa]|uniref:Uncharacterized protein n=1 Tax=Caerostris extrusa TaxID=172846 RepID=A0AAV4MZA7_CAEEX|nr:hypothetical protein CEXT_591121 [Caerostris extrusa]
MGRGGSSDDLPDPSSEWQEDPFYPSYLAWEKKKASPISSQSMDRFVFLRCLPQTILWGDLEINECLLQIKQLLDPLRTRGI